MSKQEALKLVAALTAASVRHYQVVNGICKGNADKAAIAETKAVILILDALTPELITHEEIENAIYRL